MRDYQNKEIYIGRAFKEKKTGRETKQIEDLVLEKKTTLLHGEAGAGKSSEAAKILQQWAEGNIMKNISCCLFLTAGSEVPVPLSRLIWDEYDEVSRWNDGDVLETYHYLLDMAKEGRVAIVIDGLDELGTMTMTDVNTAARVAINPNQTIEIKVLCSGILAKKILPGALVLATGRNTDMINAAILENNGNQYSLVDLTEVDREDLVAMMEMDIAERGRINEELKRVATVGNEYFLHTPLMTKNIIELVVKKKVDIRKTKTATEVYLMVLLQNLDFHYHPGIHTVYTMLDPPEDQDLLILCLKMCQEKMQSSKGTSNINIIEGILRNVKDKGQCFETKVLGERIQVPLQFLKKLGIFEFTTEDGRFALNCVHLSFLEFCAAASLCRPHLDIQQELSKIQNIDRFKAIVIYISGMFRTNDVIDYLISCKNLCKNFLYLVQNEAGDETIQKMYRAVFTRSFGENGTKVILNHSESDPQTYNTTVTMIDIIVQAMEASGHTIQNFPLYMELPEIKKMSEVQIVTKLLQLQKIQLNKITIGGNVTCRTSDDTAVLCTLLSNCAQWTISGTLGLYYKLSSQEWRQLAGVAVQGQINIVYCSGSNISNAETETLRDVWNCLSDKWWDGYGISIFKSSGSAGWSKLLALRDKYRN